MHNAQDKGVHADEQPCALHIAGGLGCELSETGSLAS